jgi:hypothetical protein
MLASHLHRKPTINGDVLIRMDSVSLLLFLEWFRYFNKSHLTTLFLFLFYFICRIGDKLREHIHGD